MHIGLVRLSAIGDVVLMVPLVRTLHAIYPDVKISWITSPAAFALLDGLTGVDFIVIDKPKSLLDYWRLYKKFQAYHFDVLLAAQASLRANLLYPLIKAKRKIGFDKRRAKDGHRLFVGESIHAGDDHLLDGFLRFADALANKHVERTIAWQLPVFAQQIAMADTLLPSSPYIVINPAASKSERNWSLKNYIALIGQIKRHCNLPIVLTGASHDKSLCAAIAEKTDVINLCGKTTLKILAAVLARAELLVAPDTGPVHLACAMGTRVVGLYAVIGTDLSGPYLYREDCVDKYAQALSEYGKQTERPVAWGTRVHDKRAMSLIGVDEVMEKVLKRFQSL